jgi:hypothetical protein
MHALWDRNLGVSRAVEAAALAVRPDCCKRLPSEPQMRAFFRLSNDGEAVGRWAGTYASSDLYVLAWKINGASWGRCTSATTSPSTIR